MAQAGECGLLVHSSWFVLFLEAVLGQKRARYPSVSVHPWSDLCHGADSCLESSAGRDGRAGQHP